MNKKYIFLLITPILMSSSLLMACGATKTFHTVAHKSMRDELIDFATKRPARTHYDKKANNAHIQKIVMSYLHAGMSIEEASKISKNNGINVVKTFDTKFETDRGVKGYAGVVDHIFVSWDPMIFIRIVFLLDTKDGKVVKISGLHEVESRI